MSTASRLYLTWCNYQPLPLFGQESVFLETINTRDAELVLAIQAVALRFNSSDLVAGLSLDSYIHECAQKARNLVMERISRGSVELSTLQTLCLLAIFDFTGAVLPTLETCRFVSDSRCFSWPHGPGRFGYQHGIVSGPLC